MEGSKLRELELPVARWEGNPERAEPCIRHNEVRFGGNAECELLHTIDAVSVVTLGL